MDETQRKALIETVLDLYADFRAGKPGGCPLPPDAPEAKTVRDTLAEFLLRIHPTQVVELKISGGSGMGQVLEYMKALKGGGDVVTAGSTPAASPVDAASGTPDPAAAPQEPPFRMSIIL